MPEDLLPRNGVYIGRAGGLGFVFGTLGSWVWLGPLFPLRIRILLAVAFGALVALLLGVSRGIIHEYQDADEPRSIQQRLDALPWWATLVGIGGLTFGIFFLTVAYLIANPAPQGFLVCDETDDYDDSDVIAIEDVPDRHREAVEAAIDENASGAAEPGRGWEDYEHEPIRYEDNVYRCHMDQFTE